MKALILAGGFGTRLQSVLGDVPKPMVSILGKPFLEHQIRFLREQGITEIILAVHHLADKVKSYFGDGRIWKVDITYSEEDLPLGTAGAIKKAEKYLDDTFLVINGDTYSHIDLHKFLEFHKAKRSHFSMATAFSTEVLGYDKVLLDGNKIRSFLEKEEGPGLINRGVYIFEPRIFEYIEADKHVSLEKDVFPRLVKEGLLFGYQDDGYFLDIDQPETYHQFKQDILKTIMLHEENNIRDAMQNISKTGIDLLFVTDSRNKLLGVLNDRIIKEFILNGGNIDDPVKKAMIRDPITAKITDEDAKIVELLRAGIHRLPLLDDQGVVRDVAFRAEEVRTENFPVVRGKAPLRISFSGGGTDLPHFFDKYGGVVINTTIDKYCYATIVKRADTKIIIDSDLTPGIDVFVDSIRNLRYDGKFDLIKAVINILKPDFGFEIYLHNDVPPGRGLGSSASLAVLLISLLSHIQDKKYDDYQIAEIAYRAEREELKIKGGWQDQYAAVTGGFNFMEFNSNKSLIYPLRLKEEVVNELNSRMLLCYVGRSHDSGALHTDQQQKFVMNEEEIAASLNETKKIAIEIKDSLLTNNLEKIGELLHKSWENKRKLASSISHPYIDQLYEIGLKNGALGGKLLGAGGGGYLLFYFSPRKRNQLTKALQKAGGAIMNFRFEFEGTKVWHVRSKV